ncbi:sigma-54 interaction domain-containing protein [Thermoflexibacter ruber]|uniref:Regulatory protein, Fis family n=1 Tax=Thermoflexibacter ruber TaxID=1003 RepID=A0A1I2BN05_9BACT|nr:sigma-54 dependent transcriptional regulator [Thermoflexibacter ruber]SFE57536.1 regulatory protein, Fis family [Thermoflexibacter ruber]
MTDIQSIKSRFGIIGNSSALNHAIQVAVQVAATDMTVLITGESGTGKESFSKIIHQLSPRKHNNFIAINCGAIPEGTIDSELFGHEKGSFTGATEARKGYFEETNGGTIFLDEIGEMPLGTQARLLRVLENGEFIRVGSSKVQKTNVRVVAATNVDLMKAVERGKFRQDLYFRLNTVPIYIPPLRERGNDILLLFRKFAADFAEKNFVKPINLDEEAKKLLLRFRFPGNIRQLKNIVSQISVLEVENKEITAETLMKYLPQNQMTTLPVPLGDSREEGFTERESILFKALFDVKKDIAELKKLVLTILQGESSGKTIIQQNKHLFNNTEEDIFASAHSTSHSGVPLSNVANNTTPPTSLLLNPIANAKEEENDDFEYAKVEDITHSIMEEDNFSLEKQEKEMIIKALKKNNNKRKYAAQDLGISERTLYRKIRQYGLED